MSTPATQCRGVCKRVSANDINAPHMTYMQIALRLGATECAIREAHRSAMRKIRKEVERLKAFEAEREGL